MPQPIDTLKKVLTDLEWEPEKSDAFEGFSVDFGPPHRPVSYAIAAIVPDEDQLEVHFLFGFLAPEDRRNACARFIARANWHISIGNFEMDFDDGEIHFRSGVDFSEMTLTEQMVKNVIHPAMNAVEQFADALERVALHDQDPDVAIAALLADADE